MLDHEGQTGTIQNQTLPVEFKFENHTLRTVVKNGDIWFVASDACAALGLSEPHKALVRLDEDEKGGTAIPTPGGSQEVNIINESGLYNLIFTSRKPRAKAFRRWVTTAVLPSIRKTGRYDTKQTRRRHDWRPVTTMFLCACRGHQLLLPSRTISSP